MDEWDQDFVGAEVPGFILFDQHRQGEFQFGYVSGQMDCEPTERNGKPAVEWTFEGNDEMDPITGRGWAALNESGTLSGRFSIHNGESSGFTAGRIVEKKKPKKGKKLRAMNAETGKPLIIDADKIKPGKIRHPSLPDPLLRRIRAIHRALKGVYDLSLEQMEINFMRDSQPEREVVVWEKIVAALSKVAKAMPMLDRKMILKTLLGYSMDALSAADRANPVVKKIVGIVEGK
jgi:hypothetical protein